MKFGGVFRFELAYQIRRVSTWLLFVGVVAFVFAVARGNFLADALRDDFVLNSPFVIASVTVIGSLIWLLTGATVAGEAAARDARTGMHPLTYTAPVSKAEYLGGRFLAAFVVNALILLAVTAGILLAVYSPGLQGEVVGPFRPAAYLGAYLFIALPNAFIATAIQFSLAAMSRRPMAGYLGSVFLFVTSWIVAGLLYAPLARPDLGRLVDAIGAINILSDMGIGWTPIEKGTRLIALEGALLRNRLLWLGIALGALAYTHLRFRFVHHTSRSWWSRIRRLRGAPAPAPAHAGSLRSAPIAVPHVRRTFGFATCARQTLAIAWTSFRTIAKSRGGLVVLAAIPAFAVFFVLVNMDSLGVPLLPRTAHVITWLAPPLDDPRTPWMIFPLLIVFYAGELVWREREAGLADIADTAPVPEWVVFLGKFLGLTLILVAWMALLMAAGLLAQMSMGYYEFEIGVYVRALFGLQLPHYLLFAVLALAVQVAVNHRHVGHIVALLAFAFILMAPMFGIEHNLLVYGAGPGWSYSDMRGFGPSLGAWAWFKLYWAAWALLLAVAAVLLWVRGREGGLGVRLRLARGRLTRPTAAVAAVAVGLVLALGGFVFYNTNVLNEYRAASERAARRGEYERRYGRYEGTLQPQLAGTRLHVEIYPRRRAVEIRGTYQLVNRSAVAIDSIHVTPVPGVETGAVTFDRPAARVVEDDELGYWIYALENPLQLGDKLRLNFEVRSEPRGFGNHGVDPSVAANGTYFTNQALLPAIGYQRSRELSDPGDRRAHGLAPRPLLASLEPPQDLTGAERIDLEAGEGTAFEAVVGTDADQIAVAPGALRRKWTEGGRRYFHYSTSAPIGNEYTFHSANYVVREAKWSPSAGSGQAVAIQIFHHPSHSANVGRMVQSVRASLDYYTEQFGPYPYSHIWLLEGPGNGVGMHAEPSHLLFSEGFTAWHLGDDPQALDLPFAVVAHEMAHQFQVPYAPVEGASLLSESFAWYAAMRVVEKAQGPEHLRRLRSFMRKPYPFPPIRSGVPLLRARDPYAAYRKGPFALYALSEYIGGERMNGALRRLIEKHDSGAAPLATSLDLYRELQAVTPDSIQYLLHDLFEANTFWELETERATAEQTEAGTWQVTLDVRARKLVVDTAGVETRVPMDDWVEVGVFAPAEEGNGLGEPIYLQKHRIRSAEQTITVTVPRKPARAGIDPYHLLIDWEIDDNVDEVKIES